MIQKLLYNFQIGLESITNNLLRGFLTSLGIIFGVASVIAMMAIGRGAKQEILEQMKVLGSNNIIIKPLVEQKDEELNEDATVKKEQQRFSPGLTLADAESIMEILGGSQVEKVSPEIVLESSVVRGGFRRTTKLVGVDQTFFELTDIPLESGQTFSADQLKNAGAVCVIGSGVKARFFPGESAVGKRIKCGKNWLTVIGVARDRNISKASIKALGIRDYDMDIYIPIKTVLMRFKNRALVSVTEIKKASGMRGMRMGGDRQEDDGPKIQPNYHQLDQIVVQVNDTRYMSSVADVLQRMLERRHNRVVDFEVIIPELLLAQRRKTNEMMNVVLVAIAAISLVVGGIGIMNIMLASVMERIKEIGVRLSLGATKKDITYQFLSEAVSLSLAGGLLGIGLGILLSYIIEGLTDFLTLISPLSIVISFLVSITVGIGFGFFPAYKAANQDPVISLRHE